MCLVSLKSCVGDLSSWLIGYLLRHLGLRALNTPTHSIDRKHDDLLLVRLAQTDQETDILHERKKQNNEAYVFVITNKIEVLINLCVRRKVGLKWYDKTLLLLSLWR